MKSTAFLSMLLFAFMSLANNLSAADYYWVHPATASANWSDPANWRTTSGGATPHAAPPTAADNVFFDANSFITTGLTVVVDAASVCADMNWTGATNAPTFAINTALSIHGNLTFITGMTVSGAATVTFTGGNPQVVTMAGRTFGGLVSISKTPGSQLSLADAFATTGNLAINDGDFQSNNHAISSNNLTVGAVGGARTVNFGTSAVTINGLSLNLSSDVAVINSTNATFTFTNTVGNLSVSVSPTTVRTYGNLVFPNAGALRNITLTSTGVANHTFGNVTVGANANFRKAATTGSYTFGSFTMTNSTVAGAGATFSGTSNTFLNFSGTFNVGGGNAVTFDHAGTLAFNGTATLSAATASSLTVANTVTGVTHTGAVTYGGAAGSTIQYNNTGTVAFNGTTTLTSATAPANNTLTFANTVTTVNHTGAVAYNNRAAVTYNNAGSVTFGNNLSGGDSNTVQFNNTGTVSVAGTTNFTGGATPATAVTFANTVTGVTHTGAVTYGGAAGSTVQYNNTGAVTFGGTTTLTSVTSPATNTLTFANSVTTVNHTGAVAYNNRAAVTYNNAGSVTFGNNLSGGDSNTVQFNNTGTVSVAGTTTFASGAAPASAVTFANTVTGVTHTGAVTYGGTAGSTVQYNNTGTVTFSGTTTLTSATGTNFNNLTFANSMTNVFHRGNVDFNNRANVTYNNTGVVHVRTAAATSNTNFVANQNSVVTLNNTGEFVVSGNTDIDANSTLNCNNTGNIDFGDSDGGGPETFRLRNNSTLNVTGNVQNIRFWGDVTSAADNTTTFNFQQVGDLQIDRDVLVGNTVNFTTNASVRNVSIGRDVTFGTGATFTMNNNGAFTIGQNTTFGNNANIALGATVTNAVLSGNATFGSNNAATFGNTGTLSIGGNVTYNGGGSNFQYNNVGTVDFGGTVTANSITGTLAVNFTNNGAATYNGNVLLTTATGAANGITYNFSGGQTAAVNGDFTVTGACDNLVTIGKTGSGSATLNLAATPATRTWVRVAVSNVDASSLANNIRAYAYTDGGGNSGIDFKNNSTSANRTLYWVAGGPQAGTNTLWSNANNWSFEPNEFIPAVCIPTVADSVVFGHHDISFSGTNATVDVDGDYAVAGMRWSATDVTPVAPTLRSVGGATRTLTIAGAFDSYRAAGTINFQNESATQRLNFTFTGARRTPANGWNEIRSGGVNFPREVVFNGNADNTRWRLIDNFSARIDGGVNPSNNGSVYLQRGVFDTQNHNLTVGRFNANQYGTTNFTNSRELIISGASRWTIQGRTGGVTAGSLPVNDPPAMDLRGGGFTFNSPHPASYWYFSGANNDSTANSEGSWVGINLGRGANVAREVPNIGVGYRHGDIDFSIDAQPTPFNFRELRLSNNPAPGNRQIYIQTWDNNNTQLIFKGLVDFGNNTNVNPNNNVGTVIRGPHVAPDATWSNISRFEKAVIIGDNSRVPFWGNFRFDGPVTVGELSRVWFSRDGGAELIAAGGNRYRFNDNVTLGQAAIAYFYASVDWPIVGKTLLIGEDALAYVGNVPSTTTFPTEYGNNNWQNIVLGHQGRLILNNGEGTGTSFNNTIVNLTFGEFSVVELNTEVNTTNANATPRTNITGTMSASFTGACSSWATLRSIVDGKQADLVVNSAQTVNALVVKDINVVESVAGTIDVTVNAGADAGNNSGTNSLTFTGSRTGRNFYWVGGTNKDKTLSAFRKAIDTNYDGTPDDNGDNVVWSNPANWYSEDGSLPRRTTLTPAMITSANQCIPTIIDNVYFLDDSFKGGNNTGNIFQNRRNVLVDIPQAQARNFEWHITTAAFAVSGNAGAGFNADCTTCGGPARFTNEQQPILPTTEIQIAGNLRWVAPGGALSTGTVVTETVLRNDFTARFSFIGTGTPQSGPGTGPTTHTIESNGQRFAGEVMFDNRYSTWTPIDPMDLNSHRHLTYYPIPPSNTPGGAPAPGSPVWSRASIIINQGALNMGSTSYKAGEPRRINLEGDWTISGLFDHAQFDASTSEVVFDGSADENADANNANIIMHENIRVPAPNQPVNSPNNDPNRSYDPTRRRFYDLTINKRQNNDWDVRVLNSPVSVMRNIFVQQGRFWDNDEGGSTPMQIKGRLSGTGTFRMNDGTTLRLGSNTWSGTTNRYMNGAVPVYNWGTEFPAIVNGYPTTFPLGYRKTDITLHENSNVIYWQHGHQNVSIVPDYGNITLINPNNCVTDFNTGYNCLRKRHLINETVTGNVTYGDASPGSSTSPAPAVTNGGTLTIKGSFNINGGIDFLDNGNQVTFLTGAGANATRTLTVGPRGWLSLGSGIDATSIDASNRTLILANTATTFPAGYTTLDLDATSFVLYNAGVAQTIQGLSGAGNASYGRLLIANRDRTAPPALVNKTLNAPAIVRSQLRIYPNAHLLDNGNQITMTDTSRVFMLSTLPGTAATAPAANLNGRDLHDLRQMDPSNMWQLAAGPNGESRLSIGNPTTATTFPANVPNNRVFLQSRTTVVYNAGIAQSIRTFTDASDTTQIYANLVLVNPAAGATAPVNKTAVQETGSGAVAQAASAAGDATNTNTVGFQLKGDLIIAPNNSFIDNGYQVRNPNAIDGDGTFRMPVLKATADALIPRGGRATLIAAGNATGVNGISRIMLGTADIATQFPVNFSGTNDVEIDFEIAPNVSANLYSNVVYNSGRRQIIRNLDKSAIGMNRVYGHITLTNPSATPNGPVPKLMEAGDFHMRGSLTINPNNNLRTGNLANNAWRTVVPVVHTVSGTASIPQLQMFSSVATATAALGNHNPQGAAINGPSLFTIIHTTALTFPVFPAYNATHLNLQEGTTIAYANQGTQSIQALADASAQAQYANLWLMNRDTNNNPNFANKTVEQGTVTSGAATGYTSIRIRGSLVIGCNNNMIDNGLQIIGTSGQAFRMYQVRNDENTFIHTGMPASYGTNAIAESVGKGAESSLFGGTNNTAFGNGVSIMTLGLATVATQFPTNYQDTDILMQNNTTVRYNAGPVAGGQTIRALFNTGSLTADNNYANIEIVNPNTANDNVAIKNLAGNIRVRGSLYISGGITAVNRNTATNANSTGRGNELNTQNHNINIQGNWLAFTNGNGGQVNLTTFAVTTAALSAVRSGLFIAGTGTVTFEGNARAQRVMPGSVVSGTGTGLVQTISNRFYNVIIDKGTAGTVHGRTVYIIADPMLVQQTVTFTNGFFWSNADGTQNGGTTNRQDDDNQITFLNNPGTIQVLGTGTFLGAPGPHNNSYVVGAVRKIGTSATAASAVGGANTFDFPIGHTPFVTGDLPDTWLSRGYYYAPSGVLDLTANHDFVGRYYGTNANLAGGTIPAGIRPQDLTNPGGGNHFPTNVKAASLRFINESEFWTIDYSSKIGPATPTGLAFRAKLSWDSSPNRTAVNTNFSSAPLKVAHWTNKGGGLMWYDESRSAALGNEASGRGVQVSVSTTYNGPFNNADDAVSILPIELVSFKARAVEGDREKAEITWQTAWERDNDYFEVEKSRDGVNFQSIARVEPKGNNGFSNSLQNYVHYDEQPWLGKNYYRLKQVDFDGTTSYSKIEVVIFERNALAATAGNMEVYPNPFESNSQSLKVVLPEGGVGAGWLVIWDMAGREMYRERVAEGQTQLEILPEETQGKLANGAYIIRAIGRDKAFTAKVVVE